ALFSRRLSMTPRFATVQYASWAALAIAGALSVPTTTLAATTDTSNMTPQQRFEKESAKCASLEGARQQACMREAAAAKTAPATAWTRPSPDQLAENARRRCARLPPALKDACLRRVAGEGTQTGSVAGGGIFRTLTVDTPGVQPETAPPTAAGPASAPSQ